MKKNSLKTQLLLALSVALLLAGWALFEFTLKSPEESSRRPLLRIMTYNSFFMADGPGPILKAEFEQMYDVDIEFIDGGDSALMVEKLRILHDKKIDLVLGISLVDVQRARNELQWNKISMPDNIEVTREVSSILYYMKEQDLRMLPFDWAPMAFVYREGEIDPPKSWADLKNKAFHLSTTSQDPRFSIPGNFLSLWSWDAETRKFSTERISILRDMLLPLSPSWSTSYGLFKRKNAKMTFTYTTSPFYHQLVENDSSYKVAVFDTPHPFEVEWGAIPVRCESCYQAEIFLKFLLKEQSQRTLMRRNFMLPIVAGVRVGSIFDKIPEIPLMSLGAVGTYSEQTQKYAEEFVDQLKGSKP